MPPKDSIRAISFGNVAKIAHKGDPPSVGRPPLTYAANGTVSSRTPRAFSGWRPATVWTTTSWMHTVSCVSVMKTATGSSFSGSANCPRFAGQYEDVSPPRQRHGSAWREICLCRAGCRRQATQFAELGMVDTRNSAQKCKVAATETAVSFRLVFPVGRASKVDGRLADSFVSHRTEGSRGQLPPDQFDRSLKSSAVNLTFAP